MTLSCYFLILNIIIGCQIYGFFASAAAFAEIWSLAAVSGDRFQAILHPLDKHKRISKSMVSSIFNQIYVNLIL